MYCKKCGNQLNEDGVFCTRCGTNNSDIQMNSTNPGQSYQAPPVYESSSQTESAAYTNQGNRGPGYYVVKERSLLIYILLSIITCGIYSIIFWYRYVEDLNLVCEGDGKETQNFIVVILLTIITCGIYSYIWMYGMGDRLQQNAPRYGLAFVENGTTVLMWELFGVLLCGIGPFIGMNILIKNMNALAVQYNQGY